MYKSIREFYGSNEWRQCRNAYWAKKKGLCERCLKNGIIRHGDQVHHRIRLTVRNINDPEVTTNDNNLELLCRECHEIEHKGDRTNMFSKKRYVANAATGEVSPREND